MENTVTISLSEYEKLKELKVKKLTFWDVKVKCPHCNHVNKYNQLDVGIGKGNRFVYCDCEDGGCDKEFILHTEFQSTFTHKSSKIPE